jgi:hypothetical protein
MLSSIAAPPPKFLAGNGTNDTVDVLFREWRRAARVPTQKQLERDEGIDAAPEQVAGELGGAAIASTFAHTLGELPPLLVARADNVIE